MIIRYFYRDKEAEVRLAAVGASESECYLIPHHLVQSASCQEVGMFSKAPLLFNAYSDN